MTIKKIVAATAVAAITVTLSASAATNRPSTSASLHSMTKRTAAQTRSWADGVIDYTPEGKSAYYYREVLATTPTETGGSLTDHDYGYASEVINNGDVVYMRDPITLFPTDTYIKGERVGDEIHFALPQAIYSEQDETGQLYIFDLDVVDAKEGEPRELVFEIAPNNDIVQANDVTVGIFYGDEFMGFAETGYALRVFHDVVHNRPTKTCEEWVLEADGYAQPVEVCFYGDDLVFIDKLYKYIDGSAIRGKVVGDKIEFAADQFLGVDPSFFYFTYFKPARRVGGSEASPEYEALNGPLVFSYDAEKKVMSSEDSYLINSGKERVVFVDNYDRPRFSKPSGESGYGNPRNPIITRFVEYRPDWNFGACYFELPKVDTNGNLLDIGQMAYNIYYDRELVTFRQGEIQLIVQDYVNVPYELNNYFDIQGGEDEAHAIFFRKPVEIFGVRSIFAEDYDESTWHYSEIVEYPENVGVSGVGADAGEPVIYDLSGRRVTPSMMTDGVYIIDGRKTRVLIR